MPQPGLGSSQTLADFRGVGLNGFGLLVQLEGLGRLILAQPDRTEPAYDRNAIEALVAYIGSLGGPPVPQVDVARGSVSDGQRLFTENCAACHQIVGRGGVMAGAFVPTVTFGLAVS